VAKEHTSYKVFNRLSPKIRSKNLAISVSNQSRKKRWVIKHVGDLKRHFSAYMVTANVKENKESQVHASVNVVTSEDPQDPEDRSPQNQTNTTNTGKGNGRKGRPRKIKEQAIATNLEKKRTKKIILLILKMEVKTKEQQASRLIT
jgi:hypothetical protein